MGSENCGTRPRPSKKGIYFPIESTNQNNNGNYNDNSKTPVKLDFLLENAEKGQAYRILISFPGNVNKFSTERITASNNNILFNTCYICDYFFERQQYLNISLEKNQKNKGYIKIYMIVNQ